MVGQLWRQILDKGSPPDIHGVARRVMSNHGGEASADAFADLPGTELTFDAAALVLRWRTLEVILQADGW